MTEEHQQQLEQQQQHTEQEGQEENHQENNSSDNHDVIPHITHIQQKQRVPHIDKTKTDTNTI